MFSTTATWGWRLDGNLAGFLPSDDIQINMGVQTKSRSHWIQEKPYFLKKIPI